MKLRLFGKILIAFWLTLFVMSQGFWLVYHSDRVVFPSKEKSAAREATSVLALLARRVETSGAAEAQKDVLLLAPRTQEKIRIFPTSAPASPLDGESSKVTRDAVAPDGRRYQLTFRIAPGPFDIPAKIVLGSALAGLVFSVALAIYLTRPLMLLRAGFRRMAQGDLNVQLEDRIGHRGDEISDLARDFDLMAARLRQLITARDRLLNDVSHELRSPLTRLQLAIGLARQDPARSEDSLDRIDREAQKLDGMVHELLALARAESGAAEEVNEYFDPIAVVEDVVSDARFEAQTGGRRIDLVMPDLAEHRRPSVRGSAELVRRAVENVVRNALRFSPAGGAVRLEVDLGRQPLRYRFLVTDEGAGVPADDVGRLFDPFVRGDAVGIGLGLSIAKRAILAHGGQIVARNRDEGGFQVEIEIPAVALDPSQDIDNAPSCVSDTKGL